MNRPPTTLRHRLLALALLVTVVTSAFLGVGRPLADAYARLNEDIEEARLQLGKFRALAAARPALEQRVAAAAQLGTDDAYYLQGNSEALAAAALQDYVRAAAEAAGATLQSTHTLPAARDGVLTRIAVSARMTIDDPGLQILLHSLETGAPLVFVTRLGIRTDAVTFMQTDDGEGATGGSRLSVDMEVSAYARGITPEGGS